MFTGIIQNLGKLTALKVTGKDSRDLTIETGFSDLELGESVAVNGVCLTLAQKMGEKTSVFSVSPETLERTTLGSLREGSSVNLERALLPTTRLSGHWVQGHVDGLAQIKEINPRDGFFQISVLLPKTLSRYCVEKGSIALDGISLTINTLSSPVESQTEIGLMIVPHTWSHTRLSSLSVNDFLNVEVDILAKYVERLLCPN